MRPTLSRSSAHLSSGFPNQLVALRQEACQRVNIGSSKPVHRDSTCALNRHEQLKVVVITLEARHHFLETRIMGGCSPPHRGGASGASEWMIMGNCGRLPQTDPRFEWLM